MLYLEFMFADSAQSFFLQFSNVKRVMDFDEVELGMVGGNATSMLEGISGDTRS